MTDPTPDWEEIRDLFAKPSWITPASEAIIVGNYWIMKMKTYRIDLSSYDEVRTQSGPIYDALKTRTMPHTTDDVQYWPDDALLKFDKWRKRGFPWRNKPAT